MFVCIQIDPTKSFTATFVHLWLFETHSYVMGRDTRSGHICHYSNVLGWGINRPLSRRNLGIFCENVCLHLNRPKKSFGVTFVHKRLFETHLYVLGRDTKSGHICHYSYVLGWGTKRPSISRNLATYCMFRKC